MAFCAFWVNFLSLHDKRYTCSNWFVLWYCNCMHAYIEMGMGTSNEAQKCLCSSTLLHVRTHACNFLNIYYHDFTITFLALSTPCVSTNNILHQSVMPALVIFCRMSLWWINPSSTVKWFIKYWMHAVLILMIVGIGKCTVQITMFVKNWSQLLVLVCHLNLELQVVQLCVRKPV